MSIIVLISVGLITILHRLILPFRKTGTLIYETAFEIFSLVMHITIFINLFLLFNWIGLIIATAIIFVGGVFAMPFGFIITKTHVQPNELLAVFAIFSWINIGITITHLVLYFL